MMNCLQLPTLLTTTVFVKFLYESVFFVEPFVYLTFCFFTKQLSLGQRSCCFNSEKKILISEIPVSEIHVMQGVGVLQNKWKLAGRLFRTFRATVV